MAVAFVAELDMGSLSQDQVHAGMQMLIDTGEIWNYPDLKPLAMLLVSKGICHKQRR